MTETTSFLAPQWGGTIEISWGVRFDGECHQTANCPRKDPCALRSELRLTDALGDPIVGVDVDYSAVKGGVSHGLYPKQVGTNTDGEATDNLVLACGALDVEYSIEFEHQGQGYLKTWDAECAMCE